MDAAQTNIKKIAFFLAIALLLTAPVYGYPRGHLEHQQYICDHRQFGVQQLPERAVDQ